MEEYIRKSQSPISKSKFSKLLQSQIDKPIDIEDETIDHEAETSEIASQLTSLRKRHDKLKESNSKKRHYFEKLKSELDSAELSSSVYDQDTKSIQQKIEQLSDQIEESRKKYESEKVNRKSYLYVLERMKEEKISLEIKANSLQSSLKESKTFLENETDKFRKIRESQYSSKQVMQNIKQTLAIDQKRKQDRIFQLEKNIKDRQELAFRREERQKRHFEISEAAANDDRDSHEARTRETFLINRLWTKFIMKKLKNEVNKGSAVELAFKKIKITTGINEVNEIVEKFLNSSESLQALRQAVDQAEEKLEKLKEYNFKAREKLNQLQIIENPRKVYNDIENVEKKLTESYKENASVREKLKKAVVFYDQVLNWGIKTCDLVGINSVVNVPTGFNVMQSEHSLDEVFEDIYQKLRLIADTLETRKIQARVAVDSFARQKTGDIVNIISNDSLLMKSSRGKIGFESNRSSEAFLPKLKDRSTERLHN
jgi:DNA repair exonuclease SbcCD ATPase subunit